VLGNSDQIDAFKAAVQEETEPEGAAG